MAKIRDPAKRKELIKDENKKCEYVDDDGLTDKQRLFCYYYMESFNVFQAGIKAGYSPKYSKTRIYEMLENVRIKKFLEKLREQQRISLHLSQEKILNRHMQVAFSDINEFFNDDGELKSLSETDGTLIKKLEIIENKDNRRIKIELIDKCQSLDFLTKYMGLNPDKIKTKNLPPAYFDDIDEEIEDEELEE